MPNLTRILSEVLSSCPAKLRYALSVQMADLYPNRHVLETEDYDFSPVLFAEAGRCMLTVSADAHPNVDVEWDTREERTIHKPRTASMEVAWKGERLDLISVRYDDYDTVWFVIARSAAVSEAFFEAVCRFSTASEGEVLVFDGDTFRRDPGLMKDLARSSWDDLALPSAIRERLKEDTEGFFAAKDAYAELGVPWKRGLLLTGPPGNGKTHALKAIVATLGKPVFLVKSFDGEDGKSAGIRRLFTRARAVAPCVVVLEDLDSLIDDECRSALLNELDGFEGNEGMLTLATTNHPEKLDTAITKRPSRFDRTVEFPAPAEAERVALFRRFLGTRVDDDGLAVLSRRTEGVSGAAIKEASLSGLMAWSRDPVLVLADLVEGQFPGPEKKAKSRAKVKTAA
ncbi:ATP-binding protein [bacterium]|nr:MAG: ATP-binding protein [bacterium]